MKKNIIYVDFIKKKRTNRICFILSCTLNYLKDKFKFHKKYPCYEYYDKKYIITNTIH